MPVLWYAVKVSKAQLQKLTKAPSTRYQSRKRRSTRAKGHTYKSNTMSAAALRRHKPAKRRSTKSTRGSRKVIKDQGVMSHKIGIGMNHGIMPDF